MENATPDPNVILLYVENPARSASCCARILGRDPVESSAVFVLFKLDSGGMRVCGAVWARNRPRRIRAVGNWLLPWMTTGPWAGCAPNDPGLGIPMIQPPTRMGLGYIFTATDPGGRRLRVFSSS